MFSFPRTTCIVVLLALLCHVHPARAAEESSPSPSASASPTPTPSPTPVPLADVVGAAETISASLQEIQNNLAANQTGEGVTHDLEKTKEEIDALQAESTRALTPGVPLETVADFERRWRKLDTEISSRTRALTADATLIDKELARVPAWQSTWTETLASAQASEAPPEVPQRISGVLSAIENTAETLKKSRAKLLSLQSRIAEQAQRVAGGLRAIKAAQDAAVERLWEQDSAPIWNPEVRVAATQDLVEKSQASFATQFTQLGAYLAREGARLFYLALIFCVLAFLLFKIKQRAARWTVDDPALARANRVLQLPLATAGVLTFFFVRPLFEQAPRLFWVTLAALALVPMLFLLRRLVDRYLFPILNALVVFYVVAQLRSVAASLPVLSRVILLLEMLGGALFLVWFIRSTRTAKHETVSRKATRAAARGALVLFTVVFLANLLGYVGLANYLGAGALTVAYLAILLYAAAGILEGLFYFALQIWPLSALRVVRNHRPLLRARVGRIIYLAAFIIWLLLSLSAFSLREPIIERVRAFITAEAAIGSLHLSLGAVLAFGLTVWFAILLSRFIRFLLEEDIYDRFQLARGSTYAVSTILHYIILLLGFFAAIAAIGVDMTKFTILAGALGVGIGFGLQNIINNFVSGLILLFERPVQVGDVVEVGGATGAIQRIGIRASVIRLANASEMIVPNGMLISEKVGNWTLSNRQRRMELRIGVAYGTDPTRVIELLTATAAKHPLVAAHPEPRTMFEEFGNDALLFDLQFWTDDFDNWPRIKSDVAVAVNDALAKAEIAIPFPQRDLHLQSIHPAVASALQDRAPAHGMEPARPRAEG
ncbi:MAG: mechanosensitive ion channel domain-containing protein [Chthoniobacterales bacterium]